jgi:hypothetical protein
VEVDGEVVFACSRRSDDDDACVLPGDVFPLNVVCHIVVLCLSASLVAPVFVQFSDNKLGKLPSS